MIPFSYEISKSDFRSVRSFQAGQVIIQLLKWGIQNGKEEKDLSGGKKQADIIVSYRESQHSPDSNIIRAECSSIEIWVVKY